MQKKVTIILLVGILLAGIGILLYPTVSSYINRQHGSYAITQMQEQLSQFESEDLAAQRSRAEAYNAALTGAGMEDGFSQAADTALSEEYYEILAFHDGIMGYLQIPKINVYLPIYHGVESDVLEKGAGHMPQSAFPIGGEGNHTVLTGHTGLPTATLFTDLTKLQEGDLFYICILEETLTYQVDQIKVVLPEQTEDLMPVAGKDYCTLVTCTPYGINSHRLLVRGVRIENPESSQQTPQTQEALAFAWWWIVLGAAGAGGIITVVIVIRKKRK